jgi:LPS-assembly protein
LPTGSIEQLVVDADALDFAEGGWSELVGGVRLATAGRELTASALKFDESKRLAVIDQSSRYRDAQYTISSGSAVYDFSRDTGTFTDTEFTLNTIGGRGKAGRVEIAGSGQAKLEAVSFSTCAQGSKAWFLAAEEISLDRSAGLGRVRNATLRLADVPVLYLPYFQYPIDGERHSGLLFPHVGSGNQVGIDIRQPIYLNLASHYDAILTPRWMSDRGVQLGASGRYLLARARGDAAVEYMPNDSETGAARSLGVFNHAGLLNQRLAVAVHYAEVSDRRYYEDLSTGSRESTLTHLERSARLTYQAPAAYALHILVQDFQPLSSSIVGVDDPYQRLPEIRFDALTRNSFYGTRLGGSAQLTHFARENSVEGLRANINPFISIAHDLGPVRSEAQFNLLHTAYHLDNPVAGQDRNPSRTTPIVSLEASLPLERIQPSRLETLTPRLFYLYVPHRNQDTLPLFDTGEPDYDFPQLFVRNRFNGGDRIADAHQITTALTWRVLDANTGASRITGTFGQIYRFRDSLVALPGENVPDRGGSDWLADIDTRLSPTLAAHATVNVSPDSGQINRNALSLRYREGAQRADLAYRYRRGQLEQADLSGSTPIAGAWRVAARLRNSLRDARMLDTLFGLEYDTCCWALRGSYRRTLVNSRGEFNSGLYLQLELKGLTRFGTGFDELLPNELGSSDAR